ncbi:alkaline phosphatase family protein [Segetibacter sp.]|jgi:phosphoglycerol transferase MdoB-like AlkP superfamily enzyme|uniref:LTA synthase family protein n=1 Tax=Segetibacter sp. TaxID=2231182 RepID=UPI00261ED892|nr:alkaline phosphatase family protein [Segetibacter sp.]MCW3081499.1 sulfatase [Segetibacter sp.]
MSEDKASFQLKVKQETKEPAITRVFKNFVSGRFSPVFLLIVLVLGISFLTRIALLFKTGKSFDWTFKNVTGSFAIGSFFDLAMSTYLIVPFVLQLWFTNDKIYDRKWKWIAIGGFVIIISIFLFTNLVPSDFNADLKKGVTAYIILRFLIFIFLLFTKNTFRKTWRTGVLYFDFFLVIFLLLFNAISEWFFWDEFSVRYNFIAVDYLVYTNEVLGNIKESYPIAAIVTIILIVTTAIFLLLRPIIKKSVYASSTFLSRTIVAIILLTITLVNYLGVKEEWRNFSKNEYANELAGNGVFQFANAFWHNELDFFKFYTTLPDKDAFTIVRQDLVNGNSTFTTNDIFNIERQITYPKPELRHNVVLISVESLSGDFMNTLGGEKNITPYLDSLVSKSIFFKNLYASGTRTVRGLESLSLGLPPSSGQSIVKRPNNENLFSLGTVFRSKGYITQYIYGGYSYFDNMKQFFSNNDYEVIDRDAIKPEEVHYQNIWGVADEDLFTLAGRTLDNNYAKGKPFFSQIMTVSNHRPFTYPEGRIDISPDNHVREGAVKYTDYAINRFLKESSLKPWFGNTIFVIVSDHCAGSAGSVELPVTGYHIPMLIYAPAIIKQPFIVDRLMAQIDIPPTILGMLNFSYRSKFLGQDIFNLPAGKEKAFISTYQGLGFIQNDRLIIQSPVRKVKQFKPDFRTGSATEEPLNDSLAKKAIAYYQVSSWLFKNKKYHKN